MAGGALRPMDGKPDRMNEMREIQNRFLMVHASPRVLLHAARLAACGLALGMTLISNPALAADDDDDEPSFEEQIINKVMTGIQGRSMNNSGIDYRERSPLVIPPRLDLPPPAADAVSAPNWPKDPEVKKRKLEAEAKRKARIVRRDTVQNPLVPLPSEVNGSAPNRASTSDYKPDGEFPQPYKPSQLGYTKGFFNMFGVGQSEENVPFAGEPPRGTLVEPPPGYQTPSPNYAYGLGSGVKAEPSPLSTIDGPLKPGKY